MEKFSVVILAAGKGTRMKSSLQKVLHTLFGKSLISHIVEEVGVLKPEKIVVVVGHQKEKVMSELAGDGVYFVAQAKPLGTGHAVLQTGSELETYRGNVLVMCGDAPLLRAATLKKLLQYHNGKKSAATILTAILKNPTGYGRIKRNGHGAVDAIVEEADASPAERRIQEVNSGVYLFSAPKLFASLSLIRPDNVKGEYYLTDAVHILVARGEKVTAYPVEEPKEILGVNTPEDLKVAKKILANRGLKE